MEEMKGLPFGRKVQCGNFTVLKFTKALGKEQLRVLREQSGVPREKWRILPRRGIPFIKVSDLGDIWGVEFSCTTQMFAVIDQMLPLALDAERDGTDVETGVADFAHLFTLMMTDTMIVGDGEYQKAKALAMKELIGRQKHVEVSKEADDKELDSLRAEMEAKATIVEMQSALKKELEGKEESDEGQ